MTDGSSATSCFCDPAVHTCLHYCCQPRARLSGADELPNVRTIRQNYRTGPHHTTQTDSYQPALACTDSPGRPILPLSHPQRHPPICAYVFKILSFLRSLPTKNANTFFFPPMRATFSAHPSSLMISFILSGEQYQPRSSNLSSFLLALRPRYHPQLTRYDELCTNYVTLHFTEDALSTGKQAANIEASCTYRHLVWCTVMGRALQSAHCQCVFFTEWHHTHVKQVAILQFYELNPLTLLLT
jgi:hypothetical protein